MAVLEYAIDEQGGFSLTNRLDSCAKRFLGSFDVDAEGKLKFWPNFGHVDSYTEEDISEISRGFRLIKAGVTLMELNRHG